MYKYDDSIAMLGQKCCEVVCSFVDFVTTVQKSQRYLLEQLVDECWTLIILLSILRSATTLKQLTGEVNDSDSLVTMAPVKGWDRLGST